MRQSCIQNVTLLNIPRWKEFFFQRAKFEAEYLYLEISKSVK